MGHKVHLCDKGGVIGVYKQNPCAHLEFTPKAHQESSLPGVDKQTGTTVIWEG
jgi:hypothetical protein